MVITERHGLLGEQLVDFILKTVFLKFILLTMFLQTFKIRSVVWLSCPTHRRLATIYCNTPVLLVPLLIIFVVLLLVDVTEVAASC